MARGSRQPANDYYVRLDPSYNLDADYFGGVTRASVDSSVPAVGPINVQASAVTDFLNNGVAASVGSFPSSDLEGFLYQIASGEYGAFHGSVA